jgi:hypothetical protein
MLNHFFFFFAVGNGTQASTIELYPQPKPILYKRHQITSLSREISMAKLKIKSHGMQR